MRYTYLLSFLLLPLISSAKDKFYLQPIIGIGLGNINAGRVNGEYASKNILVPDFQLAIAYRHKKMQLSSGIGYMQTGREALSTYWISKGASTGQVWTYKRQELQRYNHILVPLTLGYSFKLSKEFSFIPAIGAGITYNTNVQYGTQKYAGENFDKYFERFSLWSIAEADLVYRLSPNVSVIAGTSTYYMLTNIVKGAYAKYMGFPPSIHVYALFFNVGIKYNLSYNQHFSTPVTIN